jgi:hypothetical protein
LKTENVADVMDVTVSSSQVSPIALDKGIGEEKEIQQTKLERSNRSLASDKQNNQLEISNSEIRHPNDPNDLYDLPQTKTIDEKQQLGQLVEKAMLDDQGKSKGYFTLHDISFHAFMVENTPFKTYEDVEEHIIIRLIQEGKLHYVEGVTGEPLKYRPDEKLNIVEGVAKDK